MPAAHAAHAPDFIVYGKNGSEFTVLYDTASNAVDAFGIQCLPTTFFIDAGGHILAQATGELDSAMLKQGVDMITG